MPIRCGIVGLPNVENPLCSTRSRARRSPRKIILFVPLIPTSASCRCRIRARGARRIVKPERILPTTVEFVDIAGPGGGRFQGEGSATNSCAHPEVDAIAHVVRCFENDDIIHVAGTIDPARDIEVINTELALADLDSIDRAYQKAVKAAKTSDKEAIRARDLLTGCAKHLDAAQAVRTMAWMPTKRRSCATTTCSPTNPSCTWPTSMRADSPATRASTAARAGEGRRRRRGAVCAAIEAEISQLDEADRADS